LRVYRIHKIFNASEVLHKSITDELLLKKFGLIVVVVVVFLSLMCFSGSVYVPGLEDSETHHVFEHPICKCNELAKSFQYPIYAILVTLLGYSSYLAYATRSVEYKQFNQSKPIFLMTMYIFFGIVLYTHTLSCQIPSALVVV
jgi:hypothetical protein